MHSSVFGIPIEKYNKDSVLVYGNANMYTNGEANVIEHLIPISNLVFDVGASIGEWSSLALKANPMIELYAFEPVPDACSILLARFTNLTNVHIHQIALSDIDGEKGFYHYAKDGAVVYNEPQNSDH